MLGLKQRLYRGDTIIEVLLAVTVFSLLAVGAIAIMNQGTDSAQRALEITQVRQQMDAQAEALRYIHQNYIYSLGQNNTKGTSLAGDWQAIRNKIAEASDVSVFGGDESSICGSVPDHAFILNAQSATLASVTPQSMSNSPAGETVPPYAQVVYRTAAAGGAGDGIEGAYGVWIEAERAKPKIGVSYIDFHIRACWENPGSGPAMTLGTIVRLYDPQV